MQQMDSSQSVTPPFFSRNHSVLVDTTWHLTGRTPSLSINTNCVGKCGVWRVLIFGCMVEVGEGDVRWKSVDAKGVCGLCGLLGSIRIRISIHWHGVQ